MIEIEILTSNLGCSKCDLAMEIIKKVTSKYEGKIKVIKTDIIKHPEKLTKYSVLTTPSVVINGKLAFEGTPNEKELDEKIKRAL